MAALEDVGIADRAVRLCVLILCRRNECECVDTTATCWSTCYARLSNNHPRGKSKREREKSSCVCTTHHITHKVNIGISNKKNIILHTSSQNRDFLDAAGYGKKNFFFSTKKSKRREREKIIAPGVVFSFEHFPKFLYDYYSDFEVLYCCCFASFFFSRSSFIFVQSRRHDFWIVKRIFKRKCDLYYMLAL
jgi:hypothetical protein